MTRLLCLALLVACNGKDTDTDIVDTGTDTDVPDTLLGFIEKPADVARTGDQLRAGLVEVSVEADGAWTVGANLASARLSGTGNFGVVLPEANPAAEVDLPGGARGTLYLPVVYDDLNRNETFEENVDDVVVGYAPDRWLAWISSGADREGWVVVDARSQELTTYPLSEQVVVRLRGLNAVSTLKGVYGGDEGSVGVVGVDERQITGGEAGDWITADAMVETGNGNRFEAVASGRPPVGVFQFRDDAPRYVRLAMVYFRNNDGSSGYDAEGSDELLPRGLCLDGEQVYLRYVDTPRTVAIARDLERLGWTSGWRFVTGTFESQTELNLTDVRWASYGDDCPVRYAD